MAFPGTIRRCFVVLAWVLALVPALDAQDVKWRTPRLPATSVAAQPSLAPPANVPTSPAPQPFRPPPVYDLPAPPALRSVVTPPSTPTTLPPPAMATGPTESWD